MPSTRPVAAASVPATASPVVRAVSRDARHGFSKAPAPRIDLVEGHGVQGDAHAGATVQHLFPKRRHPERPNLRQVHLLDEEFHHEAARHGFDLDAGDLGENVLTAGLDLRALPTGTLLTFGPAGGPTVRVTGLRNPCHQIDGFRPGLLKVAVDRDDAGQVVRKVGVMAVVTRSGPVSPGDLVRVQLPSGPHRPLQPV